MILEKHLEETNHFAQIIPNYSQVPPSYLRTLRTIAASYADFRKMVEQDSVEPNRFLVWLSKGSELDLETEKYNYPYGHKLVTLNRFGQVVQLIDFRKQIVEIFVHNDRGYVTSHVHRSLDGDTNMITGFAREISYERVPDKDIPITMVEKSYISAEEQDAFPRNPDTDNSFWEEHVSFYPLHDLIQVGPDIIVSYHKYDGKTVVLIES